MKYPEILTQDYVFWVKNGKICAEENKTIPQQFNNWFGRLFNFSFITGCSYKTSTIWEAFINMKSESLTEQTRPKLFDFLKTQITEEKQRWFHDRKIDKINIPQTWSLLPLTKELISQYLESIGVSGLRKIALTQDFGIILVFPAPVNAELLAWSEDLKRELPNVTLLMKHLATLSIKSEYEAGYTINTPKEPTVSIHIIGSNFNKFSAAVNSWRIASAQKANEVGSPILNSQKEL